MYYAYVPFNKIASLEGKAFANNVIPKSGIELQRHSA